MRIQNIFFPIIFCVILSFGNVGANTIGDLNGDGNITVSDGVVALNCAANLKSEFDCNLADVDGNGNVTVTDGVTILRYAAGIKNTFRTSPLEPLPCGYFTSSIANEDLPILDTHISFIADYVINGQDICEQIKSLNLSIKPFVPAMHDKNDSAEQIWTRTEQLSRDLAQCISENRIGGIYVWDEPDFKGVDEWRVSSAVEAVNALMPGLPTMIYFQNDNSPRPIGLTYQLVAWYDFQKKHMKPEAIEKRLLKIHASSDALVVPVVRAWDDGGKCCSGVFGDWTDEEISFYNDHLFHIFEKYPFVAGVMYFTFNGFEQTLGARDLPITRQTIDNLCFPSKQ